MQNESYFKKCVTSDFSFFSVACILNRYGRKLNLFYKFNCKRTVLNYLEIVGRMTDTSESNT